ncbi:MAG: transglutaminase domain-containing protein [Melioribacteraceae bacterium]|nr:transglutaminase domain-containing protein [Melioribacteraceae bacterium]
MRIVIFVAIVLLLTQVVKAQTKYYDINIFINNGEFAKADRKLDSLIMSKTISEKEHLELEFQKERMDRIRLDFRKSEKDILDYVKKYFPDVTREDLKKWEDGGTLEYKIIDGTKFYFNRAASNLFLLNKEAKAQMEKVDGKKRDDLDLFLEKYLSDVVEKSREQNTPFVKPERMRLNYKLVVEADVVPDGEIIRCWLPFPREKGERQKDVKLISINNEDFIISPSDISHSTIYTEQVAKKGKPTEFKLSVEFTGVNEYYYLNPKSAVEYKTNSDEYIKYTSERTPHIIFTERVKEISEKIVGDEKNPILIAKKIYKWINDNIPWAGAREYSTIENISDYCLSTMHGDCGIKTLTFITLARYNGIPARWESGLMLHPNKWNLHDWGEVYFEGIGWVPVDQSFGLNNVEDESTQWFFLGGNDAYHMIVNDDFSKPLYPSKIFTRSETVDFQRGEVEWRGGNLYFDKWDYFIDVEYLDE